MPLITIPEHQITLAHVKSISQFEIKKTNNY